MVSQREVTLHQTIVALSALAGVTLLSALGKIGSDATIAIYSGVIGYVLAVPLASRAGNETARANGMREGLEAANGNGGNGH